MNISSLVVHLPSAVRELVVRHYRPELHYMRGPGPAHTRRMAALEQTRETPQFVDPANVR